MDQENPYQSPIATDNESRVPHETAEVREPAILSGSSREPAISTGSTIFPRYIAANFDMTMAAIFMLFMLKANPWDYGILHVFVAILAFLAYFFIFEGLFARTPGKLLMGLVVRKFDGGKCGWREAAIRTGTRILEANPILLGALPASATILISKNRQRFGDMMADTVVVLARRVK